MRYCVLGPIEVQAEDGGWLSPRGQKQRLLLAVLLLHAPRVVPADRLIDLLWPRHTPDDPTSALQVQVSRLRAFLREVGAGAPLRSESFGYGLAIDPSATDAARCEALVGEARRATSAALALPRLDDALSLWRGEPYAEFADLPYFLGEITRLRQVRAEALERRAECLLALGRTDEAVLASEALVQDDPLRERPRALFIEALYRGGRSGEALAAYEAFRRLLSEELGLDPSPSLRQLKLAVLRHERALAGSAPPDQPPGDRTSGREPGSESPSEALTVVRYTGAAAEPGEPMPAPHAPVRIMEDRGTLPVPLTQITGRTAEIECLTALLERTRLLTLTGPGGAGKTRLATELGHRLGGQFEGGCRFVELAPVREPEQVAPTIAHTLGLPDLPGLTATERLKQAFGEQSLLLVLDNFEHVAPAARVVRELLGACPRVRVLVTSRAPLRVEGEQEFPLSPLPLPDPSAPREPAALFEYDAVRLFVQRARSVRPDFRLTADNAAAVAELCIRLDGLPLAIELAAARTRLFPPEALLQRLARHLDVLQEERSDRPDRHRRLSQAIGWSHELLDARAQRIFAGLSVFRGGFTLDAAEKVCDDVDTVEAVETLLDQNLVYRRDVAGEPRFFFLETVHAFAQERLAASGDAAGARQRHAAQLAAWAEALEPELTASTQTRALDRLEAEHDNLRAALEWSQHHEPVLALRLAAAAWRFWIARGHLREARMRLERLLSREVPTAGTALRARLLLGAGTIAQSLGEHAIARAWLEEALALHRRQSDRRGTATVLNTLAWVACELTQLEQAAALAQEALALCREVGDRRGEAVALNNLGLVALFRDDGPEACRRHAAGLELRRAIGDHRGAAFALCNLAYAECLCEEYTAAQTYLDEADRLLASVRDPNLVCWSLTVRAMSLRRQSERADAVDCLTRALAHWAEGGNRWARAYILTELGELRLDLGEPEEGERLLRLALEDWRAGGSSWGEARVLSVLAHAALVPATAG